MNVAAAPFAPLVERLGIDEYLVADHHLIPRAVALAVVAKLGFDEDVNLNGTSHAILADVFEVAGRPQAADSLERRDLEAAVAELVDLLDTFPQLAPARPLKSTLWDHSPALLATSKLDAVNRISALTASGPESLGPGSKERRSVFENLYRGLGYGQPSPSHSKPQLAGEMLERLGGEWDNSCWSSGYTVTLEGLNRLLLLASFRLGARTPQAPTPAREAQLLLAHLAQVLRGPAGLTEPWSGRSSVDRMLAAAYRHARHTEWAGWFFEFLALDSLIEEFGGGPHVVEPVTFDYKANYIWDLKTHSRNQKEILLLNDQRAVNAAVGQGGGLGFIVLHGEPGFDGEPEFWRWHKQMRAGRELSDAELVRGPGSRRLKTSFRPLSLEAYWLDADALRDGSALRPFRQGKQADGSARHPKYQLHLKRAEHLRLHSVSLSP
ncbi:MAG TPA: hypothetical protein VK098_05765 [Beutenbergiaceae bacterium]|nr:hypothetical protein [Beutenbergiaceae bacterium]